MSFDKDYPGRKDHRKPYKGAKSFDRHCRNHGTCEYCKANRQHQDHKRRSEAEHDLNNWQCECEARALTPQARKELKEFIKKNIVDNGIKQGYDIDFIFSDEYDED